MIEQPQQQLEQPGDPEHGIPPLPIWPTSVAGPEITPPPPGTRSMAVRTDQVVEVGYDEELGRNVAREE